MYDAYFLRHSAELWILKYKFPHLSKAYAIAQDFSRKEIIFFIIDARKKRDPNSGLFARSYPLDMTKEFTETTKKLLDDLNETKARYHFVFMFDDYLKELEMSRSSLEAQRNHTSMGLNLIQFFILNGFSHVAVLNGGFKVLFVHRATFHPITGNA